MKRLTALMLGIATALAIVTAATAEEGMKEGKWEITMMCKFNIAGMDTQAAGMMGGPGSAYTSTQCLTKQNPIPQMDTPPGCGQPRVLRNDGNSYVYEISCNSGGSQMEQRGEYYFTGDTMHGSFKFKRTVNGQAMEGSADLTGRYLGPC